VKLGILISYRYDWTYICGVKGVHAPRDRLYDWLAHAEWIIEDLNNYLLTGQPAEAEPVIRVFSMVYMI